MYMVLNEYEKMDGVQGGMKNVQRKNKNNPPKDIWLQHTAIYT